MLIPLSLVAAAAAQGAVAPDLRPVEPMDVFQLEGIASPLVSPDGAHVVYSRLGYDVMSDRMRSELWIHDVESGENRPLLERASSAAWSPDGERLAYVAGDEDDGAEIHIRWMDTGRTWKATRLPKSPGSLAWSPDGARIAFTMLVPAEPEPLATMPAAPEGAEWAPRPKVIEHFRYRGDGAGYLDPAHRHIFVLSADGGTPRQITEGPRDHGGQLAWTDGTKLLFSANLRDDLHENPNDSDLYLVDVRTKELSRVTDRDGPDGDFAWDPGARAIAWLGFDDRRQGHQQSEVQRRTLDGGEPVVVTADFDRNIDDVQFDGDRLLMSYQERGVARLAAWSGGAIEDLGVRMHGFGASRPYAGGQFHARGGTLAFVGGDPAWPGELHVARGGAAPARVTDVNADLREIVALGPVEELVVESGADGREVQGWIVRPPAGAPGADDGPRPMILEIHGGPFLAYGPQFSFELQLYAALGYVVVYGNPRGSLSYGEEFGNLIHHAYPSQDYDDLMALVDGAIARGGIDEDRLHVTGGSGGGVLTAWIVGTTDRFASAVVAKPVINWLSFSLTSDAYDFFWQYWFPAAPWEDPQHYWERSPLSLVGNVTTPTMLLTGEEDFRTPISESEQYFQALKIRGVETAMVRVPEASHGITARPSHLIAKVLHIVGWFERER